MPGTGPRAKNWSFTLNNYTPADVDRLSAPIAGVDNLIFGREAGVLGTPHLQGTVCFQSRKRLQQVVAVIGRAHCSVTRHLLQSIEYCKKDGNFSEVGCVPANQENQRKGKSELEEFKQSVKEGVTDLVELRELHSAVCASHSKFVVQYVDDNRPKITVDCHPLREWQGRLNEVLLRPPDKREIIFIVDVTGNQGKSWFARYYCDLHENAQIVIPGKKADMAFVINPDSRVFFFDCPRSKQGDFIQYDFLEELKNGYIFSPKYQSKIKRLQTPHVVVLMNEYPEMTKLSVDRYKVCVLN